MENVMEKLSPHPHHPQKGWRFQKGVRENGNRLVLWLGIDRELAQVKYNALSTAFLKLKAKGKNTWTKAEIDAALAFAAPEPAPIPAPSPVAQIVFPTPKVLPTEPNPSAITLHQAFDKWVEHMRGRIDKSITLDYFRAACETRIDTFKHHFADRPLSSVGLAELEGMHNIIAGRPISRHSINAKQISVSTADSWLMTLGLAFKWFEDRDYWLPPTKFSTRCKTLFNLSPDELYHIRRNDPAIKKGKVKPRFTLDELKVMYKLATENQRLFLLMGISLGWGQTEISRLRKDDLVKRGGEYFIEKDRSKTEVPMKLWVNPELAQMLIGRIKQTPDNAKNLALLTSDGNAYVHWHKLTGKKCDTIARIWRGIIGRAAKQGVRRMPFARLRKTGSQMIRNLGDRYMSQLFLGHTSDDGKSGQTVADQHYNTADGDIGVGVTDFDRLFVVQKKVYEQAIKPMIDAALRPTIKLQQVEEMAV
jgi:integrase